jgi:hypothetical protein
MITNSKSDIQIHDKVKNEHERLKTSFKTSLMNKKEKSGNAGKLTLTRNGKKNKLFKKVGCA